MGGGVSWVVPGFLNVEAIDSLEVPDVDTAWPQPRFLEQYDEAQRFFGPGSVRPPVPHGILEQALDMLGDDLLLLMADSPDRAGRLFDVLADTVIRVKEFWDRKCFGKVRPGLSLGGCSTTMLSPEMVEELLAPRYERIASRFGDAFLCCCGVTTQHLETWARIEDVRYVRCGWGTDLAKAARLLRRKHLKASLDVVRAAKLSPDELEKDVRYILETRTPVENLSVLLIHASDETPDENVRRLAGTAFSFADDHNVPLKDTSTCKAPARSKAE